MPGVRRVPAELDGGALRGGAPRAVWQTLAADPRLVSACSAAERLRQEGRPPHLVWNPVSGEIVQLIPVVRAARSLGAPEGLGQMQGTVAPGGQVPAGAPPAAAVNRQGRLCVQIGVVGWAHEPFTDGPMNAVEAILGWLATWGVPSRWPVGRPAPYTAVRTAPRSRALWAAGGHFGASQVPGWDAAGPGNIDIGLLSGLFGVGSPAGVPPQRPVAGGGTNGREELENMLAPRSRTAPVPSLVNVGC